MSILDFNRNLRALELRKLEKERSPGEETRKHFESLLHGLQSGVMDWNADVNEVELVNTLTKEQVMDFFMKKIHPQGSDRKTLTLLIVGEVEMIQSTKASRAGDTNPHRSLRFITSADSNEVVKEEDERDLTQDDSVGANEKDDEATNRPSRLPLHNEYGPDKPRLRLVGDDEDGPQENSKGWWTKLLQPFAFAIKRAQSSDST
jgi:hypothetical protein